MKKLIALLMAMAMMLTAVGTVFAEETEGTLMVGACRLLLEPSEEVMATQVNFAAIPSPAFTTTSMSAPSSLIMARKPRCC